MHFLISTKLQRNGVALALRLSYSQLKISENSQQFKDLTNSMRTISCETENVPASVNGKQRDIIFYFFLFTNGNIRLVNGSILNLQFCVNTVYHAVNILHALSETEMA